MTEHTSLELSKRLHGKGFRAEHKSVWANYRGVPDIYEGASVEHYGFADTICPAYTFTELFSAMPSHIDRFDLFTRKGDNGLCIVFYAWIGNLNDTLFVESHESPAEALGLLVEWLVDEGHLEVKHEG